MQQTNKFPSINQLSAPLVRSLIENADALRLKISRLENGAVVVDAGIQAVGGLEAGRRIAEICLGKALRSSIAGSISSSTRRWNACGASRRALYGGSIRESFRLASLFTT